jgi:hypothetical protein
MESKKPTMLYIQMTKDLMQVPYGTNVGAPVIRIDDVVSGKQGISNVNKQFESKFNELKIQYQI